MSSNPQVASRRGWVYVGLVALALGAAVLGVVFSRHPGAPASARMNWQPRKDLDTSGFSLVLTRVGAWGRNDSLEEISRRWHRVEDRLLPPLDQALAALGPEDDPPV